MHLRLCRVGCRGVAKIVHFHIKHHQNQGLLEVVANLPWIWQFHKALEGGHFLIGKSW